MKELADQDGSWQRHRRSDGRWRKSGSGWRNFSSVRRGAPGLCEQRDVLAGSSRRAPFKGAAGPTTTSGSSGAGGGGNAGGQPSGDPAAMAQKMGESLRSATVGGRGPAGRRRHRRVAVLRRVAARRRAEALRVAARAACPAVVRRRVHRSCPPIRACGPQRRPVAAGPAVAARAAAWGHRRCPRQ